MERDGNASRKLPLDIFILFGTEGKALRRRGRPSRPARQNTIRALQSLVAAGLWDGSGVWWPGDTLRQVDLAVENGIVFNGQAKGADIAL